MSKTRILSCDDVFDRLTQLRTFEQSDRAAEVELSEHLNQCDECRDFFERTRVSRHQLGQSIAQLDDVETGQSRCEFGSRLGMLEDPSVWEHESFADVETMKALPQSRAATQQRRSNRLFWQSLAMLVFCVSLAWMLALPFQLKSPTASSENFGWLEQQPMSNWGAELLPAQEGLATHDGIRFLEELGVHEVCFITASTTEVERESAKDESQAVRKEVETSSFNNEHESKQNVALHQQLVSNSAHSSQPGCCTDCHRRDAHVKVDRKMPSAMRIQQACMVCHLSP